MGATRQAVAVAYDQRCMNENVSILEKVVRVFVCAIVICSSFPQFIYLYVCIGSSFPMTQKW